MKVQDLAKELKKSTKELIKLLIELDIKVKSGTTKLEDSLVGEIKALLNDNPSASNSPAQPLELKESTITVGDLAKLIKTPLSELMRVILSKGQLLSLNSEVDAQTARDYAKDLEIEIVIPEEKIHDSQVRDSIDKIEVEELDQNSDNLTERPPIITIMGHVDHGKTLLLDSIRKSNIVSGEAGGITQHIGAYQVNINNKLITFLDTPGHAAFTTLRARGAQVTDIAILVVAANEGIKPQTIEAINHAKSAKVPIIVAINKIDVPGADPEQIKQDLTQHDLVAEEWGGKIIMVPISAKTKEGIDTLLEMILLEAEVLELKAITNCPAKGIVIESRLSKKTGPVATILIRSGTLKIGDNFVIDSVHGKVRALINDLGKKVTKATPGAPIEVLGISSVPSPGSVLEVVTTEKEGKQIAEKRYIKEQEIAHKVKKQLSMEIISRQINQGEIQQLNLIIKSDVNGSLEAILSSLEQIPAKNIAINIVHSATGTINENDIMLAVATDAIVIAFNTSVNADAQKKAEEESIEIKQYSIIYEIIDVITKVITGMFIPEFEEIETAQIEVRNIFHFSKVGSIAGCHVMSGKVTRNTNAKVFRAGTQLHTGKITSLKRFKEDTKEVATGFECGVVMENFPNFKEGDTITCFELKEKKT